MMSYQAWFALGTVVAVLAFLAASRLPTDLVLVAVMMAASASFATPIGYPIKSSTL